MSHAFDRTTRDPYVEAAKATDDHLFRDPRNEAAGAEEQIYDVLSNAIVEGLGDIAAGAFRHGVNSPQQMEGLANAVAQCAATVFATYLGEIDPEPMLRDIESNSRIDTLTAETRSALHREVERTRQLEHLLLTARRLPDLVDYAGSLGLQVNDDLLDQGTLMVGTYPTPTAPR